jgi:predicted ATP-binding protein involved in virulence
MRIDRLTIQNFNGFRFCEFELNPRFNLLIGDNAAGKSSAADALSIAVGSWFLGVRGYSKPLGISGREVHIVARRYGDIYSFEKQFPSRIKASGLVMGKVVTWARELSHEGGRTTSVEAKYLSAAANEAETKVRTGFDVTLPLICTYGTERLWFESGHRKRKKSASPAHRLPTRLDGYRDCIDFTIQESSFLDWIRAEVSATQQRERDTTALRVFRHAITGCVEEATDLYYDERYKDLVVVLGKDRCQLFQNLSDGQRIMLTLVGDLARRAITLNPQMGEEALEKTPGVVIIDELDLHLHPRWQRHVIHDLKRTFPSVQFVATTHSPQLIGEAQPEEIRKIDGDEVTTPLRSYGIDSSRVLEEVMDAKSRNNSVEELLGRLFGLIDKEDFSAASNLLHQVEEKLGPDDPEVTRARTLMTFLESKA